ncbi:MAG: corrinoid protein [Clostridia bacterium]|nr:corrinoid protein [Clostridia bacterium]
MFEALINAIVDGDEDDAAAAVEELLADGIAAVTIINDGLIAAMNKVGELFREGELFVPEVMLAANITAEQIEILKPYLGAEQPVCLAKVVIGTVKGDLHDIGKNLVSLMLANSGFNVINLGMDVPPEEFCRVVRDEGVQIVAMSALLTTTMPMMAEVIKQLQAEGLREQVKVIIGGAPVSAEYAERIGADGYSPDAAGAVALCKQLIKE